MKKKNFSSYKESPFGERSLVESLMKVFEEETIREDVPISLTNTRVPEIESDFEKIPVIGRDFLAQTFNRFKKIMKEKLRVS